VDLYDVQTSCVVKSAKMGQEAQAQLDYDEGRLALCVPLLAGPHQWHQLSKVVS
jgi:hypothetical protein